MPFPRVLALSVAALALGLAGCHSGGDMPGMQPTTPARGQLLQSPPQKVSSISVTQLLSLLGVDTLGQELLQLQYHPLCTVEVYHLEYETIGGQGEATTASGALMVPSGSGSECQGARPIVEYAHGTSPDKNYDIAALQGSSPNSEGLILAAVFAAEGDIVVAPNYAGYDTSALSYHAYLVADQQAGDMMDALTAARSALSAIGSGVSDNHKLYITGYSQGGYVAMATQRALEAAGQTVTASGPMSGPYALSAFGDAIFMGEVNGAGTRNVALLTSGYQHSYGNLYSTPTDMFASAYASNIGTLLPSTMTITQIETEGLLPSALFSSTPPAPQYAALTPATAPASLAVVFAQGFGDPYLIINDYRLAYLQDEQAHPDGGFPTTTNGLPPTSPGNTLRQDLLKNDLRNWTPKAPTLLCAGDQDPEVFYFNTQLMQSYWTKNSPSAPVTVVDIDSSPANNDPYAIEKEAFKAAVTAVEVAAVAGGATDGGHVAVLTDYHAQLVAPFCLAVVKSFFDAH